MKGIGDELWGNWGELCGLWGQPWGTDGFLRSPAPGAAAFTTAFWRPLPGTVRSAARGLVAAGPPSLAASHLRPSPAAWIKIHTMESLDFWHPCLCLSDFKMSVGSASIFHTVLQKWKLIFSRFHYNSEKLRIFKEKCINKNITVIVTNTCKMATWYSRLVTFRCSRVIISKAT